jgi:hypothetical protein
MPRPRSKATFAYATWGSPSRARKHRRRGRTLGCQPRRCPRRRRYRRAVSLKVEAAAGGPGQTGISLAYEGAGGERYSVGLRKGSGRTPAPKVKILDDGGKILAEGNSEYG